VIGARRLVWLAVASLGLVRLASAGHGDVPPLITEPLTIESATLTESQFLAGDPGSPAAVGGQLRLPITPARVPAVVLVHGETGVAANVQQWADVLNSIGLAVLVLDSFTARGLAETSTDYTRLSDGSMVIDAFRALQTLARYGKIDPRRIAVLGFSRGGTAALLTGVRRFQRAYARPGLEFAAHLALYPSCATSYRDDEQVSARPLRVLHGTADDWMPIEPCRAYVNRLRRAGADAALVALKGAPHLFDVADLPSARPLPGVRRDGCLREERAGTLVNRATGRPATREECERAGATIGHDPRAYDEAVKVVKDTLMAALGGG
jgi:dienelactone hydrolase